MELLVVVIVLSILTSLAIPRYLRSVDERYRREAKDTLEELYAADAAYRQEHGRYSATIADLPVQDPNSRGTNYPLNFTLASTTDAMFHAQANYPRRPASSTLIYNPSLPPPDRRQFSETGWD